MTLSNLSVFLLNDIESVEEVIRISGGKKQGKIYYPSTLTNDDNIWFISKFSDNNRAQWFELLSSELPELDQYKKHFYNHPAYGLLILKLEVSNWDGEVANKYFAIPFGYGIHLLDMSKIEPHFGMKCVVNTIPRNDLRQVDLTVPEQNSLKKKNQSSINVGIDTFDVNRQKDILKGISGSLAKRFGGAWESLSEEEQIQQEIYQTAILDGVVEEYPLGKALSGSDSLRISGVFDSLEEIKTACRRFYTFSCSDRYLADFGWIDNLKIISSHEPVLKELNSKLVEAFYNQAWDGMSIAAPEYVGEVYAYDGYTFSGNGASPLPTMYPSIEDFIEYYGTENFANFLEVEDDDEDPRGLTKLKNAKLKLINTDNEVQSKVWPIYKTISWETELHGNRYILSEGCWYKVADTFKAEVEGFFENLVANSTPNTILPRAKAVHDEVGERKYEAGYNTYVATDNPNIILFDLGADRSKRILADGHEFCDLFAFTGPATGQMIHVKVGNSSSSLSHLFRQGAFSSQMMKSDGLFRQDVITKSDSDRFRAIFPGGNINPQNLDVCFAVILKANQVKDIPFFSKVSIKDAVQSSISRDSYRTHFWFIEREEAEAAQEEAA